MQIERAFVIFSVALFCNCHLGLRSPQKKLPDGTWEHIITKDEFEPFMHHLQFSEKQMDRVWEIVCGPLPKEMEPAENALLQQAVAGGTFGVLMTIGTRNGP